MPAHSGHYPYKEVIKMIDRMYLNVLCPICNRQLEYKRYSTSTMFEGRIHCINKTCEIDTGRQASLADAFSALMYMYYGAQSMHHYKKGSTDEKVYQKW